MFTHIGKPETKFKPIPGRVHPREGNLKHRKGRAVKDADGRVVARKGEVIRTNRNTVCGLRDKMACASSSAKAQRFAVSNKAIDHAIDFPVQVPTPARVGGKQDKGGRSGGFARLMARASK